MDSIKIEVIGNIAKVTDKPAVITSGTVGLMAEFTFDSQWEGLTKTAVFRACGVMKSVDDIGTEVTVPWEVLMKHGVWLTVGVTGINRDGTIVIPTLWANVCVIKPGATTEGDPGADPTLPVWQQIKNDVENLCSVYLLPDGESIEDAPLDAGVVIDPNGEMDYEKTALPHIGENGNWWIGADDTGVKAEGKDGYTPVKGFDYYTPEEKQELTESILANIPESGMQFDGGYVDDKGFMHLTNEGKDVSADVFKPFIVTDVQASEKIARMEQAIADLQYVPIDITSMSNNVGTAEMGSTVESVTISWALNKEPKSQMVNGKEVAVGDRSAVVDGPFTSEQIFTVKATDERGATDSASTSISFYNGVYYGVLDDGVVIDSAAVLSLTKKLKSAKGVTFTDTAGDNQRFSYAHTSRYGTPKFVIGGFEYEWTKATIDFTNASGYTEKYDIWQHGQPGGGNLTVAVS